MKSHETDRLAVRPQRLQNPSHRNLSKARLAANVYIGNRGCHKKAPPHHFHRLPRRFHRRLTQAHCDKYSGCLLLYQDVFESRNPLEVGLRDQDCGNSDWQDYVNGEVSKQRETFSQNRNFPRGTRTHEEEPRTPDISQYAPEVLPYRSGNLQIYRAGKVEAHRPEPKCIVRMGENGR